MTTIDFASTTVPTIPSKWDIIPVHSSDRASFKFCRRQWKWSSPNQFNLVPSASVYGVQKNLWFGTGIHHALERYYSPVVREDPAVAWDAWFNLQWRGGVVSDDDVAEFVDRNPRVGHDGYWTVDGLKDILPDTHLNEELFMEMHDLGIGMMKFYKEYAEANDNFRVLLTEHDFSVPVVNDKGEALYMVDKREMPKDWEPDFDTGNDFGPLMYERTPPDQGYDVDYDTPELLKQVHVRGRMDVIIQELEFGRYGIRDYKTASKVDGDYFRHLELDEQCTSYLSFGELEAKLYGYEFDKLEFIDYVAILKGYPKPPTMLKNGMPSISRTSETTTAELFEKFIADYGLKPVYDVDDKLQNYYAWLLEQGDKRFIHVEKTWRNSEQRKNAMTRLYYEAYDMLNDPVPYPNPTKNYSCLNCVFRTPCIQAESGDDYVATLKDGYITNWNR